MKFARSIFGVVSGIVAASFLLGYWHPFGDADLFTRSASIGAVNDSSLPAEVRTVFMAKCGDCHSLQTRTPIYAHFAPGSWLVERDVVKARAAMNLSQWDRFTADQRAGFKAKIAHVVRKNEMPPAQYLVLHWGARLSATDIRAITQWTGEGTEPAGEADLDAAPATLAAGDATRGRVVFEKRCTGCHALTQDREGPHLQGVYGRTAGTVSGFDYSNVLTKSHIVWNEQTLNRWLTDPQTMVPGADMDFFVAKPDERADVIQYLKQQSGK